MANWQMMRMMINNSPAFQHYPKDILADLRVQEMSLAEEGAYRRLIDFCWLNGSIPNDEKRVARIIGKGATPEMARIVMQMFVNHPTFEDELVHPVLEEERDKQASNRKARQQAAEARWGKQGKSANGRGKQANSGSNESPKCKSNANALQTNMQNDALHTPTPKEKDKPIGLSKKRKHSIPSDFCVTAEMRQWSDAKTPNLDVDHETQQFIDHYNAKGENALDWTAKWRTWMRNAFTEFGKYPHGKPSLKIAQNQNPQNSPGDEEEARKLAEYIAWLDEEEQWKKRQRREAVPR